MNTQIQSPISKTPNAMNASNQRQKTIAILTGGGDVPGLNPAINAITTRALREGFRVIGIKNGWKGAISIDPSKDFEYQDYCIELDENIATFAAHSGSTFLHSSRINPDKVVLSEVPTHLTAQYNHPINDLTQVVIDNLKFLNIDYLIPIGGDDSLNFAAKLHKAGIKLIAIPKTMDGDVPGTEYCIGFSTCVTRTIELTQAIRSSAGANERLMVIEVFGKNAGFSALLPTVGGAADHCVIPEFQFNIDRLAQLMVESHHNNLEKYAVVLVSEGASFEGMESHYPGQSIGELVAKELKHLSAKYNNGKEINVINQKLGYLVRSGHPDALDSIVPTAYANLALDLIRKDMHGRMVCIRDGQYTHIAINQVFKGDNQTAQKQVSIEKFYDTKNYKPKYDYIVGEPMLILTRD